MTAVLLLVTLCATPTGVSDVSARNASTVTVPAFDAGSVTEEARQDDEGDENGAEPTAPEPIRWHADLDAARRAAELDGLPVLMYFSFKGCNWCRDLEAKTLAEPALAEVAGRFHWVALDRDRDRFHAGLFHVASYPSLLVIGPDDENLYRWSGFDTVDELLVRLTEAERRWRLFATGEAWDIVAPRPDTIVDPESVRSVTSLPTTSKLLGAGATFVGDDLWTIHGPKLYQVDPASRAPRRALAAPRSVAGLTSDGTKLYLLPYGWTRGEPILVVDPATGKRVGRIVTSSNRGRRAAAALGLAWHDDRLWVLESFNRLHAIDPQTGNRTTSRPLPVMVRGLASDGEHLIAGNQDGLYWIDPASGEVVRELPTSYPVHSVGYHDGRLYVFEAAVPGFDRQHRPIRVWPKSVLLHVIELE